MTKEELVHALDTEIYRNSDEYLLRIYLKEGGEEK